MPVTKIHEQAENVMALQSLHPGALRVASLLQFCNAPSQAWKPMAEQSKGMDNESIAVVNGKAADSAGQLSSCTCRVLLLVAALKEPSPHLLLTPSLHEARRLHCLLPCKHHPEHLLLLQR